MVDSLFLNLTTILNRVLILLISLLFERKKTVLTNVLNQSRCPKRDSG